MCIRDRGSELTYKENGIIRNRANEVLTKATDLLKEHVACAVGDKFYFHRFVFLSVCLLYSALLQSYFVSEP